MDLKIKKYTLFIIMTVFAFSLATAAVAQTGRGGRPSDFIRQAEMVFSADGYGRARFGDQGEIRVLAASMGIDFRSGFAFGFFGADASMYATAGRGTGMSEILQHNGPDKDETGIVDVNVAAVKFRAYRPDLRFDLRLGYTPLSVGTLGTSGGLHTHSYRGAEVRIKVENLELAYAVADRFKKEWDLGATAMHGSAADSDGDTDILFIHSAGARYNFGYKDNAYLDFGFGHGWNYRFNGQGVIYYPAYIANGMDLETTLYGFWGRYSTGDKSVSGIQNADNEFHFGGSLKFGYDDTFAVKVAHAYTMAPDSGELNFRLTPWGNSDSRNFIQTAAQLDDFILDEEAVTKVALDFGFKRLGIPGLGIGVSYNRGWDTVYEIDYYIFYKVQSGSELHGFTLGAYAGHLRYDDAKSKDKDDIKVIINYSYKII